MNPVVEQVSLRIIERSKESRAAYLAPGTCTFYGTANTNQMLMEFMGLQLPGGSFVNPGTPLREQMTAEAVTTVLAKTDLGKDYMPLSRIVDEKAIVKGVQEKSLDEEILRPCSDPFNVAGGLQLVSGNLGRAMIKVSAVDVAYHVIEAPQQGMGRELFGAFREGAGSAESGASLFGDSEPV